MRTTAEVDRQLYIMPMVNYSERQPLIKAEGETAQPTGKFVFFVVTQLAATV